MPRRVRADGHRPEVNADTGRDSAAIRQYRTYFLQHVKHAKSTVNCTCAVVLRGSHGAEQSHYPVTLELVHVAAVRLHYPREHAHHSANEGMHFLVIESLGEPCKALEIEEENSDSPPFPFLQPEGLSGSHALKSR